MTLPRSEFSEFGGGVIVLRFEKKLEAFDNTRITQTRGPTEEAHIGTRYTYTNICRHLRTHARTYTHTRTHR